MNPVWHVYVRGWYAGSITRRTRRAWKWNRSDGARIYFEARVPRKYVLDFIARATSDHPGDVSITRTRR